MGALSWIAGYATWTGIITVLVYLLAILVLYRNISIRRERDKATRALSETKAKQDVIVDDNKWLYNRLIQSKNRLRECQEQISEVYDLTKVRRSSAYLVDALVVPESPDEQRLNEIAKRINGLQRGGP